MFQPGLLARLFGLLRWHGTLEVPDDHVITNIFFTLLCRNAPRLINFR